MNNLFYNAGSGTIYVRYQGVFYVRKLSHDWKAIADDVVPALELFSPLHPKQEEALKEGIEGAAL